MSVNTNLQETALQDDDGIIGHSKLRAWSAGLIMCLLEACLLAATLLAFDFWASGPIVQKVQCAQMCGKCSTFEPVGNVWKVIVLNSLLRLLEVSFL
jgi:hypothetical protein